MSKRKKQFMKTAGAGTKQRSILGVKQTPAILIMALIVLNLAPKGT